MLIFNQCSVTMSFNKGSDDTMLGERIRKRREDLGLTQEELATLVGYKSKSTINKIEMGINDLPQSKVSLIASALKISPAVLLGFEEKKEAPANAEQELSEIDKEIIELFTSLSDKKQELALEHLKLLAALDE